MSGNNSNSKLSAGANLFIEWGNEIFLKAPDKLDFIPIQNHKFICKPLLNKIGWLVLPTDVQEFNIPKLKLFHYLLIQHGYITCSFEEFSYHFIDGMKNTKNKILWTGDIKILVFLMNKLIHQKKIIPQTSNFYSVLIDHFVRLDTVSKKIVELKYGSLKSSLNQAQKNNLVEDVVENFIQLLLS